MTDREKIKIWNMQSYPRNTCQKRSLRNFLLLALCCLLAFWVGASIAIGQTLDEQGCYTLHGDVTARLRRVEGE